MRNFLPLLFSRIRRGSWPEKLLLAGSLTVVLVGIWARLYRLGLPDSQVFDEVYFPVFAKRL
jgi:hypothetical protein